MAVQVYHNGIRGTIGLANVKIGNLHLLSDQY